MQVAARSSDHPQSPRTGTTHSAPTASSDDPVTAYARSVADGITVAGPHVRAAARRHLSDLLTGHLRNIHYSREKAHHALNFFPVALRLNGGQFEGLPFELHPSQAFIVGSLFGWLRTDGTRRFRLAYIEQGKGNGKSPLVAGIGVYGMLADSEPRAEVYAAAPLALDTLVPTPTGWTTQGALRVGDEVFDENGKPCKVTYLSPILHGRECFDVEFDDGTVIVSDANHRWQTIDTRGQTPRHYPPAVRTTAEIAATLRSPNGRLRHFVPLGGEIETTPADLPIDPYTLGVWLGDGRSNRGSICHHYDDVEAKDRIQAAGYAVTSMRGQNNTCYATIRGLRTQLREAGLLDNKHVPPAYLRASRAQRLALLQGLMDTDGTCTLTGECRFTNRNEALVRAVHELATGLGLRASMNEATAAGAPNYTVSFKAPKSIPVFHMRRKFERQIDAVNARAKGRYVRSVTPRASVPVRCIEVSSESHLYLVTRSHIATHNTKKDQAMILFRDAVAMVDQSPALSRRLKKSGRDDKVWNLYDEKTNSFFRPISADDGQSGPRPHIGLVDELHEHKTPTVIEMLAAGRKWRRQPLIVAITNSGTDRKSVCWEYREKGTKVAAGIEMDDTFFVFICSLDGERWLPVEGPREAHEYMRKACTCDVDHTKYENPSWNTVGHEFNKHANDNDTGICDVRKSKLERTSMEKYIPKDDPHRDETCWVKANPTLDTIIQRQYLRDEVNSARGMPSKMSSVDRLNFCIWTESFNPAIDYETWQKAGADYTLDKFRGRSCVAGIDLSATTDLTAIVLDFVIDGVHWLWPMFWIPAEGLAERVKKDHVPYDDWVKKGFVYTTPGKAIDKDFVVHKVAEILGRYDITISLAPFDRWRIDVLKAACDRQGVNWPLVPFGQGFGDMGPAWDSFEVNLENKMRHPRNPCMNANAASAVVVKDPAGNCKLDKSKTTARMDGIVAATMAVGSAATQAPASSGPSIKWI